MHDGSHARSCARSALSASSARPRQISRKTQLTVDRLPLAGAGSARGGRGPPVNRQLPTKKIWPRDLLPPGAFLSALTAAREHPRQSRLGGLSSPRDQFLHFDICDSASVPEPHASMTYRVLLGCRTTLTSAIERSCCGELQGRSAIAAAQCFSLLHF